jgi:predicted nucleic acid-binding protein
VRGVLVDAGPMVAILDQSDPHHTASVAALKTLRDPLVTVWPAFTEAMYLLGASWRGQKALWSRLETGALTLAPLDEGDAPRMRELMEKYRDLPMDLADAALVRVAEREDLTRIFTLDRRHFSVYRPGRRRRFSILRA